MAQTGRRPSGGSSKSSSALPAKPASGLAHIHQLALRNKTGHKCLSIAVSFGPVLLDQTAHSNILMEFDGLPCCSSHSSNSAHWYCNARPCTTAQTSTAAGAAPLHRCPMTCCRPEFLEHTMRSRQTARRREAQTWRRHVEMEAALERERLVAAGGLVDGVQMGGGGVGWLGRSVVLPVGHSW